MPLMDEPATVMREDKALVPIIRIISRRACGGNAVGVQDSEGRRRAALPRELHPTLSKSVGASKAEALVDAEKYPELLGQPETTAGS